MGSVRHSMIATGLLVLAGGVSRTAVAQEFCVSCSEPNATYRCVITDARPGAQQSLQLSCLTALAREGGHAQCSVKRGVTIFDCDAPVKKISVGSGDPPAGTGASAIPGTLPGGPTVVEAPPLPKLDPNVPPQTVLEAAQRASKAADTQIRENNDKLKEAGNATATFLKNSLTCLGSLFTKCGQ